MSDKDPEYLDEVAKVEAQVEPIVEPEPPIIPPPIIQNSDQEKKASAKRGQEGESEAADLAVSFAGANDAPLPPPPPPSNLSRGGNSSTSSALQGTASIPEVTAAVSEAWSKLAASPPPLEMSVATPHPWLKLTNR